MKKDLTVEQIDAILPQTQCGECDFAGCKPYAEAMLSGKADINKCPPGGIDTLHSLAKLLDKDVTPFLSEVEDKTRPPSIVNIREDECIGCTKCIQACPVDAIIGGAKVMHTVFTDECTGCNLCIEPCPVDCIDVVELPNASYDREIARERYQRRNQRLEKETDLESQKYNDAKQLSKKDFIQQALARVAKKNDKN